MRILVISLQGIGNLIMQTPMLLNLKRGPGDNAIILLVLANSSKDLLEQSDLIDDIIEVEPKFIDAMKQIYALRKDEFDVAIVAFPSGDRSHIICFLAGARRRIGFVHGGRKLGRFLNTDNIKVIEQVSDVEQSLRVLEKVGIALKEDTPITTKVWLGSEDIEFADSFIRANALFDKTLVGMHPGSGKHQPYKRWGQDNFADLGDLIAEKSGARIVLFGGPDEFELCQRIAKGMKNTPIISAGRTSLRQTAALIGRCKVFVTNDSGLMHVAAALSVPTIGVFGPTNFWRTAPYGNKHTVVRLDLKCSPCCNTQRGKAFKCKNSNEPFKCLTNLSVDLVFDAVEKAMELCDSL